MTGRLLLALGGVLCAAAAFGEAAYAAPWCGTPTTQDRPTTVTGRTIRVVYVLPSDGQDRVAERAPRISGDVDEITAWWRGQDAEREPRFDRTSFACGLQVDLLVLRLGEAAAVLRVGETRFEKLVDAVIAQTGRSQYEKHLVYYDGPVEDDALCGQGGGTATGSGVAIVYLAACPDIPSASVAAHELVHAFGALEDTGPPHACADSRGHPCDSESDLLYQYARPTGLGALVLDVGRDDYYGHAGGWADVQDSGWLRLVTRQVRLTLTVSGRGSVESDLPGLDCAARCVTDWDEGAAVTLEALSGAGQRFVRWSGACSGADSCTVTLAAAQAVTALFAPERFGLVLSVSGKGAVAGAGARCSVARCARSLTSHVTRTLRAAPARGWRFAGWSGGCTGRAATCRVPMTKATAVRARFVAVRR